ncbi:MAG: FAD-dependent monooxygenase, partial [Acidobacteriota bacterium]
MKTRIPKIAIAGAGPAGSSLAIRLANNGFAVTLIERETFPRHKLCGEFISPECLRHFDGLGVLDEMLAAGGERIFETRFYDRKGNGFAVPSRVLDDRGFALSLSRSEMDRILLDKARECGVKVFEGTKIAEVEVDQGRIAGLRVRGKDRQEKYVGADLFIDATGRNTALSKLVERKLSDLPKAKPQPSVAVGFKNHFTGVEVAPGTCEIFFFPGGYGGLTSVENGLANLCFLMNSKAARKIGSNADRLVEEAVTKN